MEQYIKYPLGTKLYRAYFHYSYSADKMKMEITEHKVVKIEESLNENEEISVSYTLMNLNSGNKFIAYSIDDYSDSRSEAIAQERDREVAKAEKEISELADQAMEIRILAKKELEDVHQD